MKCPLLSITRPGLMKVGNYPNNDCFKEECAWWEQDLNLCAIKEIALELRYTQLRLADIIEKITPPQKKGRR